MATSTLIQYLDATDAVTGADLGTGPSAKSQIETFRAGAVAIADGKLVSLDLSQAGDGAKLLTVVPADLSGAATLGVIGVATSSAAAGGLVTVMLRGITYVAADAGIAAGDALSVSATGSGTTAGFVAKRTASDLYTCVGVALEATSATKSGQVKALIYKVF
jgi:hypothetical protein